jgi:hypothetical protein
MAFLLWYTNYFVDIASENKVDPKSIKELDKLGTISANADFSAWHVKSQLNEDDFKRHLESILQDNTDIKSEDITVTKGIDGGPLQML